MGRLEMGRRMIHLTWHMRATMPAPRAVVPSWIAFAIVGVATLIFLICCFVAGTTPGRHFGRQHPASPAHRPILRKSRAPVIPWAQVVSRRSARITHRGALRVGHRNHRGG
jgi:hypothetical protein